MENLLITVTSPDRPGIVERITEIVASAGGNWEESRMARLCGDFAGIVRVTVSDESAERLIEQLHAAGDTEISISVRRSGPPAASFQAASFYRLQLRGADHEGIVHAFAARIAERGVNIEELETEVVAAPVTGTPIFHLESRLGIPAGFSQSSLEAIVDEIADELDVDITLEATDQLSQ